MAMLKAAMLVLVVSRVRPAQEQELCAAAGKRREEAMCAPAPHRCVRPASVFWLYIRQCAGFSVGKGILDSLYPASKIAWGDGFSLAHEKTAGQLAESIASNGVRLVGLRHPVDRLVAQYFQTADLEGGRFLELGDWTRQHSRPLPRRGNDGVKLWLELDNAQVKILSGFDGRRPDCHGGRAAGCHGGVDDASLERAKETVRTKFDKGLVVEWLDTPQSIDWLSQLFCFEANAAGAVTRHIRPSYAAEGDSKPVPDMRRSRPKLRGSSASAKASFRASRRENATWWRAERATLRELHERNALDLKLWRWAAAEFRATVAESWGHHRRAPPPLPPLPCTDAGSHCWDADDEASLPIVDLAVLQ